MSEGVLPPGRGPSEDTGWQQTLVTRATAGDENAFEALVRLHQDHAYGVALRMTGRAHDAQDVVQEALLQAWTGLPRYRGDANFRTWLTRIVINQCHNLRRAVRPTDGLPQDDPVLSLPSADSEVVAAHRWEATMKAVLALPFDQRAPLVLHVFSGCTHAEVGRILGISESAAKVRVHRARRALTAGLKDWR